MEDSSFTLTWEDATTVVQAEEVISTMENEIIPAQSEEFVGEVQTDDYPQNVVEAEELVGVVEEEVYIHRHLLIYE